MIYALLLMGCIVWTLLGCGANQAAVPYHQGLQREATFENRLSENKSFTKSSFKEDVHALEKELRELQKKTGDKAELDALTARMAELRKQIESLKSNHP